MATPTSSNPAAGSANQQSLSEWAGPYVTGMLGKANAIAEQPYQVYQGPMTAGESDLQSKMFQGLGKLAFPNQLGGTFSSTGAYQLPSVGAPAPMTGNAGVGNAGMAAGAIGAAPAPSGPAGIAANYMNPYLQAVLNPQLDELRRQNDITNMNTNAKFTSAGAFGGGRNAIMNSENNRNMMQEMNKTVGQGYANAYDKAMGQFNTEQGQAKTLAELMGQAGTAQRGIEQEGITADYNEFLAQRDNPQKQVQFLQSMLQGLPISNVSNIPQAQTGAQQLFGTAADVTALLTKLGVIPSTAAPAPAP
jgi:hypothetical protein